jgi:glycosyltransferase involved in cell wall biosynthesis
MIIATPERRGAEQFAVDLAPKLSGTVTVRALGPTSTGAPLPVDVLGPSRFAPTTLRALRKLTAQHDVVICHGGATLIPGAAAARSVGIPFVYRSVGDPAVWTDVTMAGIRVGQPLKFAAAVVALFPAARHTLIERYGLDPDRVVVLPNAVDPDRVGRGPAIPGELRSTLGLDSVAVTKWVGYVGALSEEKRVHLAVEAVASRPDWGLLIAGDGPEEQWLRSLAAYLAPERIRFLGRRSEVAEVYDLMDALVLPSRTEGIPAVAIEAALHGVPVVATNVGGVAAAMANGVEGVLVDDASVEVLTDALASVLDGSQATAPSTNSRVMLLKHYDIAAAALAWDQLIAQAAALPAASQP